MPPVVPYRFSMVRVRQCCRCEFSFFLIYGAVELNVWLRDSTPSLTKNLVAEKGSRKVLVKNSLSWKKSF